MSRSRPVSRQFATTYAAGVLTTLLAFSAGLVWAGPPTSAAPSPLAVAPAAVGGPGAPALAYTANDDGGNVEIRDVVAGTTTNRSSAYNQGDDVAAGDVDGDGGDEVVVGNDLGTNDFSGAIDVVQADGSSTRFVVQRYDGGDDEVAVGQLVKGGPAEIAVASTDLGTVTVFDGTGKELARVPTAFGHVDALDLGDVNGDEVEEILVANADGESDGRVDVLDLAGEAVHPAVNTSYDDDDGDDAFAAGDVTGDGLADLVVANTEGDGRIDVHDLHGGEPDTAFDFPSAYDNPNEVGAESTDALGVGDVTGDDREDVLIANTEGGRVDVHNLAPGDNDDDFPSGYDDDDRFTVGQARIADLDSDGIPDRVELDGVVSQYGTSPCRKDVIVESDVMVDTSGDADDHSHRPSQQAIDDVVDAFAAIDIPGVVDCPYPGEDAGDGIRLTVTEQAIDMETLAHDDLLRLPQEFDALKADHFDAAAADRFVHYAIWAHEFSTGSGRQSGGRADAGVDDQDFVMALSDPTSQGSPAVQASTFMHELGHTIGLRHGGFENLNCKPNYLSVMNYSYPFGPVDSTGTAQLEFSDSDLPDLLETALDETVGIQDPESHQATFTDGKGQLQEEISGRALDWSGDNADGQGSASDDTGVSADINAFNDTLTGLEDCNTGEEKGKKTRLQGFDDRDALREDLDALDFDGQELPELSAADLAHHLGELEQTAFPDTTTRLDAPRPDFHEASHGVAVDDQYVYATHGYKTITQPVTSDRPGSLVVVDRDTMQVVDRIEVGFGATAVALDHGRDLAYVVNRGKEDYSLSVVDTNTREQIDEIDLGQNPVDVAVNTQRNRIYVANAFQQSIQVIDGASRTVVDSIPVGPGLTSVTVDENTGTVWYTAFVHNPSTSFSHLGTIVDDGSTQPHLLAPISLGPGTVRPADVAIDHLLARVYVGNLGVGLPVEAPSVSVVHRNTRQVLAKVAVNGPIRAITTDPDAGLVFAVGDRGVNVLGTGVTSVLRFFPAELPFSVGVGPGATRQLYVGDFLTGELRRRNYGAGAP